MVTRENAKWIRRIGGDALQSREIMRCVQTEPKTLTEAEPVTLWRVSAQYCGDGASEVLATRSAPPTQHVAT